MSSKFRWQLGLILLAAWSFCDVAPAQSTAFNIPQLNQPTMPPSSSAGRIGTGLGATSRSSKPFSSYSPQPTVSPYLNLFRVDLNGSSGLNYSTLVRPQLQQQQINQQLERQNLQTNRRLQSIAAQADFNPQGANDQAPTGHQTVYNYLGRYYQMPRPQRQQ